MGSRPRMDTGGSASWHCVLEIKSDREAARFLAALAAGHPERFTGLASWSTPTFEVRSGGPIDVGLDGETHGDGPAAAVLVRPSAVRVRLPRHAIGYSPAARALDLRTAARSLWRIALGRPAPVLP